MNEDKPRNPKPQEEASKLPLITLGVLVAIIAALLYLGWQYLSDDSVTANDLTNTKVDTVAIGTRSTDDLPVVATNDPEEPSKDKSDKKKDAATEKDKKAAEKTEKKKDEVKKPEPKKEDPSSEKATASDKILDAPGEIITHTVQSGETFYGIANRYNLKWEALQKLNPTVKPEGIKIGVTKLKVKVKAIHTVGPGDVLRVVAQKYGISKQLLMQANKKTRDISERGEKLIIPLK